jgi:phosphoglycolate phosphatase
VTVFDTIFWDWNGTLLDDVAECIEIINISLKKRSLQPLDLASYLEKFEFPIKKYYENIGFDFSRESYEEAVKEYIEAYCSRMFACRLHKSATDTLADFKKRGIKQYVLSALYEKSLHQCVDHFKLDAYFTRVRGLGDSYANSKIELGRNLLAESGCRKESSVMVGDTVHDFETACAMGIPCVLIAAGHNSRQRLQTCGVPVFDNIAEFAASFDRLHHHF